MLSDLRPMIPESGNSISLSAIEEMTGVPASSLKSMFLKSSERLRHELKLRDAPFTLNEETVSAYGIAGIVSLATGVEVEIVPKCLNQNNANWHDDFLFMAVITRLGRIFQREHVSASMRRKHKDVLTLLAAVFLADFERLSRVPIREYRNSSWFEPTIDGELDYSEIWSVRQEGFLQTGPLLSVDNRYMRVIGAAATFLANASTDRNISRRLRRRVALFPQVFTGRKREKVPGRYVRWQYLYDLATAVLSGHGMRLAPFGGLRAPGFVLNTERGWEDLLILALTSQGNSLRAKAKPRSKLGIRIPGMQDVVTYPDIVLDPPALGETVVVDAKYRRTPGRNINRISSDDLYEALAFLTATRSTVAVLVYPSGDRISANEEVKLGMLFPFDRVSIGLQHVVGATVSTNGVGETNGFVEFGRRLSECLLDLAKSYIAPSVQIYTQTIH